VAPDRRQAPRYRLGLPVELTDGRGITRDVSESGVYFQTSASFTTGAPVSFVLVFGEAEAVRTRLSCTGTVVRVEPGTAAMGVAARITNYRPLAEALAGR
jgi:PilZ domain-containing protein